MLWTRKGRKGVEGEEGWPSPSKMAKSAVQIGRAVFPHLCCFKWPTCLVCIDIRHSTVVGYYRPAAIMSNDFGCCSYAWPRKWQAKFKMVVHTSMKIESTLWSVNFALVYRIGFPPTKKLKLRCSSLSIPPEFAVQQGTFAEFEFGNSWISRNVKMRMWI